MNPATLATAKMMNGTAIPPIPINAMGVFERITPLALHLAQPRILFILSEKLLRPAAPTRARHDGDAARFPHRRSRASHPRLKRTLPRSSRLPHRRRRHSHRRRRHGRAIVWRDATSTTYVTLDTRQRAGRLGRRLGDS